MEVNEVGVEERNPSDFIRPFVVVLAYSAGLVNYNWHRLSQPTMDWAYSLIVFFLFDNPIIYIRVLEVLK